MAEPFLLIVLLVPLAWCAAVQGIRRLAGNPAPQDLAEKYQLLIMIAPVFLGLTWIAIAPFLPVSLPLPLPQLDEGGPTSPVAHAASAANPVRAAIDLKPWLVAGLLALWSAGALIRTVQLLVSLARLGHIASCAGRGEIDGTPVRFTDRAVPPLAWGHATILLPTNLAMQMTPEELGLVVCHEQAHLARKDPFYFGALSLLDALAWFNPFLRAQTQRCRMAAELASDAIACGKTSIEREAYARVLIRTLKHTAGDMRQHAPAAISNVKSGDYRMRLSEIMHAAPAARKPKRLWLYSVFALALVPVTVVQFALAQGAPNLITAPSPIGQPTKGALMQTPVAGDISSFYGRRNDPRTGAPAFHRGIDIAAPVGTAVVAPADGKVGAIYTNKLDGKALEINYAGHLSSRMTHLQDVKVKWGDSVRTGQTVATLGNTGSSTGPHLHFEVLKNGKLIDPVSVLSLKVSALAGEGAPTQMRANAIHEIRGVAIAGNVELRSTSGIVRAQQYSFETGKARISADDETTRR